MGLMGYDALNVGRDELRRGLSDLQIVQEQAAFPFLSANLVDAATGRHPCAAYTLKSVGQLKAALIGVVASEFNDTADLAAEAPAAALQRVLPQITQQAQVIVVLAHMPSAEARQLAEQVTGIHVLVVAGEEQVTQQPTVINGTLIVQPGDQGKYVGKLSITVNTLGQLRNYHNEITILDETFEDDPQIKTLLDAP